jgi:uncharacterized repeat protein (TIGR02543 family)
LHFSVKASEISSIVLFTNSPLKRTIILYALIGFKDSLLKYILRLADTAAYPIQPSGHIADVTYDGFVEFEISHNSNYIITQTAIAQTTRTIAFDANGGNTSVPSAVTGADGKLSSLPTATRSNYSFDGWYTLAAGGTRISADTIIDESSTVYAHWALTNGGGNGGSIGGGGGSDSATASTPATPIVSTDSNIATATVTVLATSAGGSYSAIVPASAVTAAVDAAVKAAMTANAVPAVEIK